VGEYVASHPGFETKLSWSNPVGGVPIPAGMTAHVGGDMRNSGRILDAYWTLGGVPVGVMPGAPPSIAISYELTEIRWLEYDPEVHMQLQIADGYFEARAPGAEAGWTGVRTFANIPASMLGLEDLNASLDLSTLAQFETTPQYGFPGMPGHDGRVILKTDENYQYMPDSFFDVYVDTIPPELSSPAYESLLYAVVLNAGTPIGQFWNLNPQSPEPATLGLLSLGALALLRRRR